MDNQEHKLRLKSLEDIENETNGLVNQISEEKKKTENGIKSVIDNVENCFEYTEKEARNRISELDTKRKDLEDIVQTKLDLASKSLKESIDILKHNYECVRDKYRKSLIIPLASLIFLIFFYESVISYLPWLDYSIYGIPVGKLSIVSLVFLLTWNSLLNLNSSFNINYKHLEKNKEDIDGTNPTIGQISISPQNFEDTKPFFKNAKEVLDNLIVRVGNGLRPFEWTIS